MRRTRLTGSITLIREPNMSTFEADVNETIDELHKLAQLNQELTEDLANAQSIANRVANKLIDTELLLRMSIENTLAYERQLAQMTLERNRLLRHVANHANCCSENANIAFAQSVARGKA